MNIGVVMYQTSFTKGQELVAQRMTLELVEQGLKAYLIAGSYHDNVLIPESHELRRNAEVYLFFQRSEFQVPLIRVDGSVSSWPPCRIMFKDFIDVTKRLSDKLGLDVIITHGTLWNGPKISQVHQLETNAEDEGVDIDGLICGYMPHYHPPDPTHYSIAEGGGLWWRGFSRS